MKKILLGTSNLEVPIIAAGTMRIPDLTREQTAAYVGNAMQQGVNFFDTADIYGAGKSEEMLGQALKDAGIARDEVIIQTKCGIIPGKMYDLSTTHIIQSTENSLKRLGTDYLDVMMLHRPDALMEPEEVAEAFNALEKAGKVRHFAVSNMDSGQIELLKTAVKQPILANQLQLSIMTAGMIAAGINVNTMNNEAADRDLGVLNYCRLHNITIQNWSPFEYGMFEGVFLNNPQFPQLNSVLEKIADHYSVPKGTIVVAWLLRHPAGFMPVIGTTNILHFDEACEAADLKLTREEWYEIYLAAGYQLP